MTRDIADIRRDYEGGRLDEAQLPEQPMPLFEEWMALALDAETQDANAMTLATVDSQGLPHARVVLLKGADEQGFQFFSNYHSHKGSELANVPHAALVFWWPSLARQVRVEGAVEQVSEQESDAYFARRPRASQLGAWVATQSVVIPGRQWLQERETRFEQAYEGQDIPRPVHWGGYRLIPEMIEFWQGQPSRLHDRIRFERRDDRWHRFRLAP
ncbi:MULTISPECIES: pyridoxamine 5'-phosphate oxidase [Halomonas]|uniref:Pyridoxine/pyridoxamine 5'-phosphate oxidase n=2 Tax=Halomonas TaxID=2745 RepID=A0ABQ0U6T7_9GAMM|nr:MULTISPECIES: pyridoxamine 5'-phosphate oxidase [Halomonas]PSJ23436.1 pyridoxamine 5'-phosphate oxidase [Halomonas sp. ND22Bw]KGE79040.1 pyridoxine 5'-phosphate oxidase [Halomonas salina]MDR5888427.1 pyridoxamine 5'-phosphate oxidase [Halomonas salina]RAH38323.1 pyridoxamine 5'-phosphate oxidase [Halomonas sp. SL1]WJY05770.1 pyridoxamine 5'-phosphate oxidase [Halomonas halophila]